MTPPKNLPYLEDPDYQAASTHFQNGEWEAGLESLDTVINRYPAVKELQALREEIFLKKQVDADEIVDKQVERKKKTVRTGIRLVILTLAVLIVIWGAQSFSSRIIEQWNNIRTGFLAEIQNIDLAIQYRDAQSYVLANQPKAAQEIYESILNENPDYPGLDTLGTDITNLLAYQDLYEQAVQSRANGDPLTALDQFQKIHDEKPNYLDVAIQIQEIKGDLYLVDLFEQAETAYEDQDWELAASQYESIHAIAPDFKTALVEQRLVRSYMNLASQILEAEQESPTALKEAESYFRKVMVLNPRDEALLAEQIRITNEFKNRLFDIYIRTAREAIAGQEDSLEALEIAKNYYRSALQLKPNDPTASLELKMAEAYLQAQVDFAAGLVDPAIQNLELIYQRYPSYANGTAIQTLYECYMSRGSAYSAGGQLESARVDFQKAAEITTQIENSVLKLYFAKVKIAETEGVMNNYSVAVNNYQEAVDLIDLEPILDEADADLSYLLREAQRYAGIEWYRTSYRLFRRVLPATDLILDKGEIVVIQEGDYLSSLANLYDTTVEEIVKANALPNASNIQMGQEIIIPTLKGIGE